MYCCKPTFIHDDFISRLLVEINSFVMTFFHNQDVDYLDNKISEAFNDWFIAINIHDNEALPNLTKFSGMRINVGLQYTGTNIYLIKASM